MEDEIPTDEQILAVIAQGGNAGVTASALIRALEDADHDFNSVIQGIQRVLDRGKVALVDDGRLVVSEDQRIAA